MRGRVHARRTLNGLVADLRVYAKFDGCKGFKAFDVNEGRQVGNLIYASLMENTEDTRQKLQKLADLNKEYHLVLQLRRKGRVCFQTK